MVFWGKLQIGWFTIVRVLEIKTEKVALMDLRWGRRKILRCVPNSKTKMARAGHEQMIRKDADDLFVKLPIDILVKILQCLPLKEAARTSVLSKMWRELFLTRPCLICDKQFFLENFGTKQNPGYVYLSFINKLLLSHSGDILDFVLYIPELTCYHEMHMDQLLVKLSTKRINKLNFESDRNSPYKLPSCMYSSTNWTELTLKNCMFKTPAEMCSFLPKLVQLSFENVAFDSDLVGAVVHNLPLLKSLRFLRCSGIENFHISSDKLRSMYVYDSHVVKAKILDTIPNVEILTIGLGSNKVYKHNSSIELSKLHETLPRLTFLCLDGPFLKHSAATVIQRERIHFRYLTKLHLHAICFADSDQISCALCLIRNSPKLVRLTIKEIRSTGTSLESVLNLLEAPNCMGLMRNLDMVELFSIHGLKSEMLFIERILATSPKLKTMLVKCEAKDAREELKIAYDLMQFCRASPKAKVICSGKFT